MILTGFQFNPLGLRDLVNAPAGGIERALETQAQRVALVAKDQLSAPYAGRSSRNPAPGPPQMRTGDLRNSIMVGTPMLDEDGLVMVPVESTSVHRGLDYSLWLRQQGYEFVNLDALAE